MTKLRILTKNLLNLKNGMRIQDKNLIFRGRVHIQKQYIGELPKGKLFTSQKIQNSRLNILPPNVSHFKMKTISSNTQVKAE